MKSYSVGDVQGTRPDLEQLAKNRLVKQSPKSVFVLMCLC